MRMQGMNDKMREEFEAWAIENSFNVRRFEASGLYEFATTLSAWQGWRAAKETPGVLSEVAAERIRQDAKWGEQNHPDWTPTHSREDLADAFPNGVADHFRGIVEHKADAGVGRRLGYFDILMEEVAEAHDDAMAGNSEATRAELIQVAAVAVAFAECIDRRLNAAKDSSL